MNHHNLKPSTKNLSIQDIVKKDVEANYPNLTFKQGMKIFLAAIMRGTKYIRSGNTLFLIDKKDGDTVYYHTINGDALNSFLYNCLAFFGKLSNEGATTAITYFSSVKTLKLVLRYKLPNEDVTQSNDPSKGKYMIITNLTKGGV